MSILCLTGTKESRMLRADKQPSWSSLTQLVKKSRCTAGLGSLCSGAEQEARNCFCLAHCLRAFLLSHSEAVLVCKALQVHHLNMSRSISSIINSRINFHFFYNSPSYLILIGKVNNDTNVIKSSSNDKCLQHQLCKDQGNMHAMVFYCRSQSMTK